MSPVPAKEVRMFTGTVSAVFYRDSSCTCRKVDSFNFRSCIGQNRTLVYIISMLATRPPIRKKSATFLRCRESNNLDNPQFLLETELSFLHLLKSLNVYEIEISETRIPVKFEPYCRSDRVAERLVLPTSDHGVSSPTGGEIISEPKRRFIKFILPSS